MEEQKKVTEINDEQVDEVSGGDNGLYLNHKIITAFGKCGNYCAGSNFYNQKVLAIGGTCGSCAHMACMDGWHVCDLYYE